MTETTKTFSIRDVLSSSWQLYKQKPLYFIGLAIMPLLLVFVFQIVFNGISYVALLPFSSAPKEVVGMVTGLFELNRNVLSWAINGTVSLMLLGVYLSHIRKQPKSIRETTSLALRRMIPYGVASLLNGVLVLFGFLLLVIPGIILTLSLQFFSYFIIDRKAGIVSSLQDSWELTRGVKMKLLVFGLALAGLNAIGILLLGIGIVVTMPVSMLAGAMVYDRLLAQTPKLTAGA